MTTANRTPQPGDCVFWIGDWDAGNPPESLADVDTGYTLILDTHGQLRAVPLRDSWIEQERVRANVYDPSEFFDTQAAALRAAADLYREDAGKYLDLANELDRLAKDLDTRV